MNRQNAIRPLFMMAAFLWLTIALLLPNHVAQASDEVGTLTVWMPYASNGQTGGNSQNPEPVTPETVTPETVTPETPTPQTPTPEASTPETVTPETPTPETPTPETVTPEVPTPETPTTEPVPNEPEPWAHFANGQWNTNSASIAVDGNGGIHLAYHFYESVGDNAPTHAVYAFCAAACEQAANWASVALGEVVNEIQLELTADGRPRLLYRVPTLDTGNTFHYAECNANCTQAANWSGTAIFGNRGMSILEYSEDEQPQRYFELDPQDRPRFVYSDRDSFREPDHLGTFYAFCDVACTGAGNWAEVQINKDNGGVGPYRSEDFYYPALAFTPSGQPRVLADGATTNDEMALHYVECNSACESAANWQSVPLWERGSGNNVAYDIEINAQGQPRVAYYDGARLNAEGEWLYYGWCDGDCTNGANWTRFDFGFSAREGQEPDLELDAAGKPHIAYAIYSSGGLAYSRCESACESAAAQWTHLTVESSNDLAAQWNVAQPPHCDAGVWTSLTPSLALDGDGNPHFGYDATYHARCWYNDVTKQWEPFSQFHLVVRTVRTYFLPKP
jgi:hypothetical protein